jgi:TfoX/Sxy family transcriptional regulator of competence genes
MEMPEHPPEAKEHFRSIVPESPGVEVKPMFGSLGAFVNGNMFAGLFGTDIGVKLGPDDRAELEGIDGTGPFGPPQRPMGGCVALPQAWRDDPARETEWLEKAQSHVATLPPKVKKAKKK